jgi:hypothetical protein
MSLFFLYPIYLLGLAAAALPVLIHLLNRRRMKRIRFPAVRFILLSQKRISRSYRLRHWLLLALRTAAIILLALLLANPVFQTGAGLFAGGGPVSLVVILDNSLSMSWSRQGQAFKQAKEAVRVLIDSLGDGDRAVVIPTSVSGKEALRLKEEKEVLLRELQAIEISPGTANFTAALNQAYGILSAPAGQKEIRLITDMTLTGWDQFSAAGLKRYDPTIALKTIQVSGKENPVNATIKEIKVGGQGVGVNFPVQIEAVLANFGAAEIKDVLVQLAIDGETREQKLATVPPQGESSTIFQPRLTSRGAHTGEIILKKEGLAGNTRSRFALHAQDKLNVLVVDGDPQTALVRSETFFISRALNPAGDDDTSLFLPTVIVADGLPGANLEAYQAVILCNVGSISDAVAQRLREYVAQGGGLLIFGGERLQPDGYNQTLGAALPARLRERKLAPEGNAEKIGKIALGHAALEPLADAILRESLTSTRVWGYLRAEGAGKAPLVSLANGEPLIVEQTAGRGRVIFVATSADRDWNDLPVKTVYLPLVQSLTGYVAGGKRGALDSGTPVGAAREIPLPATLVGKTLRISKPDKQESIVNIEAGKERALARMEDNDQAGFYRIGLPQGAEKDGGAPALYAVNPPFLESRLDPINERELQAKLAPIKVEVLPVEALKEGGKRTDLALPLVGLLLLTLLFEGWLAQRF